MARKTTPMIVLKLPPTTGSPSEGILFVTSLLIQMKANAPSHAPSIRTSPPITAITSSSIVAWRPMFEGES